MRWNLLLHAAVFLLATTTISAEPPLAPQIARRRNSRLGSNYIEIPIFRTLGGTNVVSIGIGGRGAGYVTQPMNLTLTTSANYIVVATTECLGCVSGGLAFDPDQSPSISPSPLELQYTYPSTTLVFGSTLLNVSGQLVADTVVDPRDDMDKRTILLVDRFLDESGRRITGEYGIETGFNPDTEGFYGLGVDLANPMNSLIPQVLNSTSPPQDGLIVGIDMNPYSLDITEPAGILHWGAVPEGSYRGGWNWIKPTGSLLSVWAMRINKMEINGRDVGTSNFRATIDPAQYTIIVPESTAVDIYGSIDGAVRDRVITSRWNIPCDTSMSFSVHLPGGSYKVNDTDLVQHRSLRTCWGGIVAWPGGSPMDVQGEVLLGTPFLSNVYTAFYYSPGESYVGLAAKPGVGGNVVKPVGNRLSGGAIAGIIIALIALMLIALAILFSRSRDSMAGYHSRVMRKQHKLATNQMMQQYPGIDPPPLIMQAQPVFSEPRHVDALYAKPYVPGGRQYEREVAMGMDPVMGMYGNQQQEMGSNPGRGSGFWGGWRRAREESQWREQQQQRGGPGGMVDYGEHQPEYLQNQPFPYPNPYEGQAQGQGYAPVAGMPQGEYYGPPHGDPMQYYAQQHHRIPQEHHHQRGHGSEDYSSHHGDRRHHRHHHQHRRDGSHGHAPPAMDDGQGHVMPGGQDQGGFFGPAKRFFGRLDTAYDRN